MRYCSDFKTQGVYGSIAFLVALVILYIFTKEWNWLAAIVAGVVEYAVSGFYTNCRK